MLKIRFIDFASKQDKSLRNFVVRIREDLYSIIDIEATGGNAKIGKITEVAIYNFNGEKVTKIFSSLVNPERKIPSYVQRLTGISNEMASKAPLFKEVANEIISMLEGNCFVAHNVKADYSFIKTEMEKVGIHYSSERLCTLELSKKLIPEAESHGLEKICKHLGIQVPNRHRAEGDAIATVELFKHLQRIDSQNHLERLKRRVK